MPDDANVSGPAAKTKPAKWGWRIQIAAALCLGTGLAVGIYGPLSRSLGIWQAGNGGEPVARPLSSPQAAQVREPGVEYQSTAILEVTDNRPIGYSFDERAEFIRAVRGDKEPSPAAAELPSMRVRMLGWNPTREIVLSRHVDFGRDIDPDNRRELERIHRSLSQRIKLVALGPRHIGVSLRSPNPTYNASMVNELVKNYTNEDRRVTQEQAKQDLRYYHEKYVAAEARLSEADGQIREFTQANPWLHEATGDIHKEYTEAEEKEREITAEIGEKEQELAKRRNDLRKEPPEIVQVIRVPEPPDLVEARRQYEGLKAYFEQQIKPVFNSAHARYQDTERIVNDAYAVFKKLEVEKGGGETEIKETKINPAYVRIQDDIKQIEKTSGKLNQRKLAINKRVNELYVLVRRAPELMAQKKKLDEDRALAASTAGEYAKYVRTSEKELQRVMTDAYSSRFKVIEYAREEYTPAYSEGEEAEGGSAVSAVASTGAQGGPGGGYLVLILALVVGVVIGAGPLLLVLLVRGTGSRQDAQATAATPRRRTALAIAVGGACLLLPILAAVAAVVLYPPYPRVGTPRIAGEPEAPAEMPSSPRPPDGGPPPSKSTGEPREIQATEFHPGVDIRFNQVDPTSGLVLTSTHVFRELLPDSPRVFAVETDDGTRGKIRLYRLRNVGTGETFDFADVPVRKIGTAGWVIEQDLGWKMIRDQLQAKMKIQLGMPIIGRP